MDDSKNTALQAFRLMFRPLARILLRAGVNWKELAEVGKATYVEVASEDFGIRGRPTNVSRVSILTGFTRREVRRLRELLGQEDPATFSRMNYATRVLSGWHQDADYLDDAGRPKALAAAGGNPSFESLCDRYSGDVPATTMLKELKHVGAVGEDRQGRLVAKTRYYMPMLMDPEQMLRSGSVVGDLGYTVAYNLHRGPVDPSRFERRATNTHMPAGSVPQFRKFIEQEGQAFLERVDAWLTEHESSEDSGDAVRLGLGAYWIEEEAPRRKSP
ncbi:MAG: DUF6502 family protein [Gammaproteobacteria bacterium]|nr:DUF6502 family protein [Gammaproteobacteria bacterium]MDH5308510.1 DUF6502 family protein [Gammaproteobacteria bacterium]